MSLTEERWRRLEQLFEIAIELRGEEREAFIARETADDPELARRLSGMVAQQTSAGKRIAQLVQDVSGQANWDAPSTGRRFGPYRILREIGRGGMGIVFEAVRDDSEYEKTVALKIAPWLADVEGVRERFRYERRFWQGSNTRTSRDSSMEVPRRARRTS